MNILILFVLIAGLVAAEEKHMPSDLTFTSTLDGSIQQYVEIQPAGPPVSKPDLMIALHGHGSDRMQFAKGGIDESRAARDAASEAKMVFVSPDYRAKTSWMGPAAEADLVQLIGIYRKRGIGKVALIGGSMGGTSTLIFTALHPDLIDGACAMNPTADMVEYAGFADSIAESYGGTKAQVPAEYRKRSPVLFPRNFAGIPVAFTTGGKDKVVPPDSALRLADLLTKQSAKDVLMIHRPETGHATNYEDAKKVMEFVITEMRRRNNSPKHR